MCTFTLIGVVLVTLVSGGRCAVDFSGRSRNFSLELLHHTSTQTDGHVVISPFGVWTLATGITLGAAGRTYDELRRALRLPKKDDDLILGYKSLTDAVFATAIQDVTLTSKNYMFVDENFHLKPSFKQTVSREFGAAIKQFNFQDGDLAATIANNYIINSGARVANVLNSEDFSESKMILTNVISFKGLWGLPFNSSETALEPFLDEYGRTVGNVNMMTQRGEFSFTNMDSMSAFVLDLPYGKSGKYSMLMMLPYFGTSVVQMYLNFKNVTMTDIFKQLAKDVQERGIEEIDVKIPRFKISTNVVLNKPLNDMGVYDIFDLNYANFSRVSDEPLFVSAIVHKADIEVTESGTVASAISSAFFADRITPPKFYANRPFVYFVMERSTTTIIFAGIYSKPTVY